MEENNKFETNTGDLGGGSLLYGAAPQPQTAESGHSAAYGTELTPQEHETVRGVEASVTESESEPQSGQAAAVRLEKPSEPAPQQPAEPVQLAKQTKSEPYSQSAAIPVQLAKSSGVEQPQAAIPVQQTNPAGMTPQQQTQMQQTLPSQQAGQPQPGQFYSSMNSQPMGQNPYNQPNQNPMGFGPMQIVPPIQGAPAAKPRKNKSGLIVGILCAAAVVIVIGVGALLAKSLLGRSPQQQLARGFANMAKEMAAYQSSVAQDIGLVELNRLKSEKPIHTDINLSFTDPEETGSFSSFDVGVDAVVDYKEKMAEFEASVGAYGFHMTVGTVVAADNTLYVSVPLVFENEVYSLELTNLGSAFNESAWSELMDMTLPVDYSPTLFEDAGVAESVVDAGESSELARILHKQGSIMSESMTFESIAKKREFVFDGVSGTYGGVRVTIDKDAYNAALEKTRDDILESDFYADFLKGYQAAYSEGFEAFQEDADEIVTQMFSARFEEDFVLDFYLDKKGRIINISTPADIAVSSQYVEMDSVAVDISFSGKDRALDCIDGGIYVQAGDEILYLGISRTADITEDFYRENLTLCIQENNSDDEITFWYANEWGYADHTFDLQISMEVPGSSMGITADGAYTDIVKGEGYTFRLNHGALKFDGEDMLLMTGSVTTEPGDGVSDVPENATNILKMSQSDIMGLMYGALF